MILVATTFCLQYKRAEHAHSEQNCQNFHFLTCLFKALSTITQLLASCFPTYMNISLCSKNAYRSRHQTKHVGSQENAFIFQFIIKSNRNIYFAVGFAVQSSWQKEHSCLSKINLSLTNNCNIWIRTRYTSSMFIPSYSGTKIPQSRIQPLIYCATHKACPHVAPCSGRGQAVSF